MVRLLDMGLSVGERLRHPDVYRPMTVCVTSVTSPSDFWCRRCIDDDASTTELPLLMDRIADLYASDSIPADETESFSVDDEDRLYAARYVLMLLLLLRCVSKQLPTLSLSISSPNINRFLHFFHWHSLWTICNESD